ncbi:S-adenosyl-L-methionine-dependent methyltransferase [Rhizoclosmatium globosum]|uniref:S-adenosyl-L-methionine-dependent methyltransferase n=1 Tax=Rhizoclosmatium globosum TaxID=329046 RepID=A0A1Y2C8K3_9FUNG|nr:S-adenosyl-L-methionine-dependent methyltransferase [Rhizoclosmatium globosum]|eukprot:ORY43363.1 S-adenosyl-L-methionine-dependent methyltransferase [Rhizoclosmatium globosum]
MGKRGGRSGGRGRGGRGGNRGGDRGARPEGTDDRDASKGYASIPQENATFEAYYKAQNIMSDEEWKTNMAYLKLQLPANFRFTGSKANASKILDLMKKNYFPTLQDIVVEGEQIPPPEPLPWYPNNFGWQYKASRGVIRSHDGIKKFHEFLMAETECGNVSRQEAVSMIPPLFLEAKPGHYVLDMCAAPGSKTAQLIEAVTSNDDLIPSGLVVANDADYKRAFMLVKQSKRLQSPTLVVTNHEAQFFPYIYFHKRGGDEKDRVLQFDRILCDVPCSGDGTIRKNRAIWKNWNQTVGNTLNKVQIAILIRAIHFLKVGGRVVFSTCTFNPVENEAVVAAVLNMCGDSIKLLDVSKQLPKLKRRPGVTSWKVMDPDGTLHEKYDTIPEKYQSKKVFPDCFAPDNIESLHMERCMRIVPADQDTGAFFVAVFEKVKPYGGIDFQAAKVYTNPEGGFTEAGKRKAEDSEDAEEGDAKRVQLDASAEKPEKKAAGWDGKGEEPFYFIEDGHKDVADIVKFYGLNDKFPTDQLVVRSANPIFKTVYLVSAAVKKLLLAENSSKLKIVNTGVRIFTRTSQTGGQKNSFQYRVSSEGIATVAPFMSDKRIVVAEKHDVKVLLEKEYPVLKEMSESFQARVADFETGSFVVKYTPENDDAGSLHEELFLPTMRAAVSVSLLVPKEERKSLQSRIFGAHFAIQEGLDKDGKDKEGDDEAAAEDE